MTNASFENSHFKCSEETIKILHVLLQKGADPNEPPSLLAYAINLASYDVCRLLLEYGASPTSAFYTEHIQKQAFSEIHPTYIKDFNEGNETALHAAARIGSQIKIELLLQHGADPNIFWIGETYRGIEQKYKQLKSQTLYRVPLDVNHAKELAIVQACRQFMYKKETRFIIFHISEILNETMRNSSTIKFN